LLKNSLSTFFPSIDSTVFEDAKNDFSTPLPYTEKNNLKTLDPQQRRSEGTSFKLITAKVRATAPTNKTTRYQLYANMSTCVDINVNHIRVLGTLLLSKALCRLTVLRNALL